MNIFDAQDSQVIKQDNIGRLGHDEKALMPIEDEEDSKLDMS